MMASTASATRTPWNCSGTSSVRIPRGCRLYQGLKFTVLLREALMICTVTEIDYVRRLASVVWRNFPETRPTTQIPPPPGKGSLRGRQ